MQAQGAEPRRATVPKIFRDLPGTFKFPYPGPVKKALKDINYIKDMMHIPCGEAGPQIVITTGLAAGAPALLSLFLPGCLDIAKAKVGLSPWHARGITGLIKGAAPPIAATGNKFLYKLGYFTAEKYLWFFQVAEVTKEFFITWQSQIYMAQQCQLPGAGTAYGYFPPFIYGAEAEQGLDIALIKPNAGVAVGLSDLTIQPGFQASVAWDTEWDSYPIRGNGINVNTWYTEEGSDDPLDFSSSSNPANNGRNITGGSFYYRNQSVVNGHKFRFFMQNTSGENVQCVRGTWTVSLQGRHAGLSNFGCQLKAVQWPFPPAGL